MSNLNKHPFAVEAFFEKSLVLAFAVPKEELVGLIPDCLELDLFEDKWAFFAVAMVDTKKLRPKGFPRFAGRDFKLIGYRVFVRYRNEKGRRLRGLYILGSETNKPSMKFFGKIFTQYRYQTVSIGWNNDPGNNTVSTSRGLRVITSGGTETTPLPEGSPFADWKEARRFAGPMPFTFTYDETTSEMTIIEGIRSSWTPAPVQVEEYKIPFLEELKFKNAVLANAFIVEKVPYEWTSGQVEKVKP